MIDATFCAGSGMIAFGAVLGKTTPTQLTWLMVGLVGGQLWPSAVVIPVEVLLPLLAHGLRPLTCYLALSRFTTAFLLAWLAHGLRVM